MEPNTAEARVIRMTIPTYPEANYESLPMFAETRKHQGASGNPFPNAVTAIPCAEKPVDIEYEAIVLENKWLEVIVLPAFGGRIFAAKDKRNGYDFFYRQHVIKPALIGDLGSWISGGVEFNWPLHHRPSTYMPSDWTIEKDEDGSVTVWTSDSDPFFHMRGTVGVCLYPDRLWIETKVRLANPTELRHPFLWWENAAVPVNKNYRLFFPDDVDHVVHHYRAYSASWPIAKGKYGGCDFGNWTDISLVSNAPHATSYFAAPSRFDFFGGYDEGTDAGVVHIADHYISPGKKLFTWGTDRNAKEWEKKLTDTDGPYCELMAGVYTDNQPDFTWLQPYETKIFSQYWIPLKGTGTPDYADLNCAVSVNDDIVKVQTTRAIKDLKIFVSLGANVLCDESVECSGPETYSFRLSESVKPEDEWAIRVMSGDIFVLEYTNESFPEQKPRIIKGVPFRAEIKSPFEAYNIGEHLLLYSDPSFNPDVYFRAAVQIDEKAVPPRLSLAEHYISRGMYSDAETELRDAIDILTEANQNPESGKASYLLGLALERQKKYAEAYDCYRKAAWSLDTAAQAYTRAAILSCRGHAWKKAKNLIFDAIRYGLENPVVQSLLLMIEVKTGLKGTPDLSGFFRLDPIFCWSAVVAGYLSEDEYFKGLRRPERTAIETACFFMQAGFEEEAQRLLEETIAYFPGLPAPIFYLAEKKPERFTVGRTFPHLPEEAEALEKASSEGDPYARYLLGVLRFGQKRYYEAETFWYDKTHRAPLRGRAMCMWRLRDRETAIETLLQACKADPFDPADDKNELTAIAWETANLMTAEDINKADYLTYFELAGSEKKRNSEAFQNCIKKILQEET